MFGGTSAYVHPSASNANRHRAKDNLQRLSERLLYVTADFASGLCDTVQDYSGCDNVYRIDIVQASIRGVPVTAGRTDHAYYTISIPQLPVSSISQNQFNGRLLFPLKEQDNVYTFGDGVAVWQSMQTPKHLKELNIRVFKPDNQLADATECSSIQLIFKLYLDISSVQIF